MKNHFEQEVVVVNAFTHEGRGGNPAAVVLEADGLSELTMQAIAADTALSETAFLSRSKVATYKLDFFTPRRRIPHCGHATVAAFGLLEATGVLPSGEYSKETVDGNRRIVIDGGFTGMQQKPPSYKAVDADAILSSLGLTGDDVDPRFGPQLVSTGNSFVLVGLRSETALAELAPNLAAVEALSEQYDLVGFYPFVLDDGTGFDAATRMFAPRYGIAEEAATGMAAGPLACLLHRQGVASANVRISQGRYMARASPSALSVRLQVENGEVTDVQAGGAVSIMAHRTVLYCA